MLTLFFIYRARSDVTCRVPSDTGAVCENLVVCDVPSAARRQRLFYCFSCFLDHGSGYPMMGMADYPRTVRVPPGSLAPVRHRRVGGGDVGTVRVPPQEPYSGETPPCHVPMLIVDRIIPSRRTLWLLPRSVSILSFRMS